MIYNNFEKLAFVMGFSYLWNTYLTCSSVQQIWFFFSYVCQLHNNKLRFWHAASPCSLKESELFLTIMTGKLANKQTNKKSIFSDQSNTLLWEKLSYFSQRQRSCRFCIVIFQFVQNSPTYIAVHSCQAPCDNISIFTCTSQNTLSQAFVFPKPSKPSWVILTFW